MATERKVVKGDQYYSIDGKLVEIKKQLREKGGYPYDPDALDRHLQRAVEGKFDPKPAMSRWAMPPQQQLELAYGRNFTMQWGFTNEDFARADREMIAEFQSAWCLLACPSHPFAAIVLDIVLDSVQETFAAAWECVQTVHPAVNSLPENFNSHLILPKYSRASARKRGLYWRTVDLAANRNVPFSRFKESDILPSSEILWAAANFPGWVRAMDGREIPYVSIPGYWYDLRVEYETPDNHSGIKPLGLSRDSQSKSDRPAINLVATSPTYSSRGWAIPEFFKG